MSERHVGPYEVQAVLCRGPRATVYRGIDTRDQRPVAIKVIPRAAVDPAGLRALHALASGPMRLEHPGIAALLDLVERDKALGVVSELCEGRPLAALLKDGAQPDMKIAWDISRQVLQALAHAHGKGAVHRDLHPGNLMLAPDGRVRITDFGVCALFRGRPQAIAYLAPEQLGDGPTDARTDLYQAGAIAYQLLTGKLPFTGTPEEIEHRVHQERPGDPSSHDRRIAWQLDWVIQKALSKDGADRFANAMEFAEGLRLGLQDTLGRPLEPMMPAAAAAPAAAPRAAPPPDLAMKARAIASPPAAAPAPPAPTAAAAEKKDERPRVLFVDDDERVLNALRTVFRQDYHVFTAENGALALEIARRFAVNVVVSDQRMPGITGVELLRKVRALAPGAVRILLTGYSDLAALVGSINEGEIFRFVKKPWDNDELRAALADAVKVALELAAAPAPPRPASPRSAGSLLVIDANLKLGLGLERLLAGAAAVRQVRTPAEAARVLGAEEVAAIVADMGPGMDGLVALFRKVKEKRPGVLSILLADEPDSELGIELVNKAQIFRFLPKPVSARELRRQVAGALRRYAAYKQVPTLAQRIEEVADTADAALAERALALRTQHLTAST